MANDGCTVKVVVGKSAIDHQSGRPVGLAAKLAGEQRDAHSDKVTAGDEAVLGDDFGLRVGATLNELEFGFISEGNSWNADGDGRGLDAVRGAQRFENAVGEVAQFFHVTGFAPVHAELEGEDVGGVKAGADTAELLKATEKQAGAGQQSDGESDLDADQQPLQGISSRDLRAAGLRKRGGETAARAAKGGNQSAEKSDHHRAGQRIEDDASVEMDFFDAGKLRGQRAEDVRRCRREKETEARTDDSQEKGFGEKLSNERAARSAQGEAHGDFVLSLGRAG